MAHQHVAQQSRLRLLVGAVIFVGCSAIVLLATSVLRQLNDLDQGSFESAQWSLSQAEIEFLEFSRTVHQRPANLSELRLRFDVFYSRIATLQTAQLYNRLRNDEGFVTQLAAIDSFLDYATPIIDSSDTDLLASLDEISQTLSVARQAVRQLAIESLDRYTHQLDQQRSEIARTTGQLVVVILALFLGLFFCFIQMDRLTKRAEARGDALQQSNLRMNTIIDTALDAVMVTDAQLKIVDFNPAAEEVFACPAKDAIGRQFGDFCSFQESDGTQPGPATPSPLLDGTKARLTGLGQARDGRRFPIELAFQSAQTPSGAINIAFIRDISARVRAEQDLVTARDAALASEKIKSDFLATMSHEIRTPLNGLIGNMDLLGNTDLSQHQQRYLHNMTTSGRMLMQHVTDVLDITQYDTGKVTILSTATNLSQLIDDVVVTQRGLAETQGTNLSWRWQGPALDWVMTDPNRLQLILMNLVGNAVKFTRGGQVQVTAQHLGGDQNTRIRLEIADTGPGISTTQAPHIFDDFYTGDASETRDMDGSGLGLGIARRFTEALQGSLGVESELGKGSLFWLELPVTITSAPPPAEAEATADADAEPQPGAPPPLHVLVVEDNIINRRVLRDMLQADGHRVTETVDGKTGLSVAEAKRFDVILMDISMPRLDGREAAQRIVQGGGASSTTPIIALTANVFADATDYHACGLVATLTKPLRHDALRDMLCAVAMPQELSGPVLETDQLAETKAALGPAFAQTYARYTTEMATLIDQIAAMPRIPLDDIATPAHKAAGSTALFGAQRLQYALALLEYRARDGDGLAVHHLRLAIPDLWAQTQTAIAQSIANTLVAD